MRRLAATLLSLAAAAVVFGSHAAQAAASTCAVGEHTTTTATTSAEHTTTTTTTSAVRQFKVFEGAKGGCPQHGHEALDSKEECSRVATSCKAAGVFKGGTKVTEESEGFVAGPASCYTIDSQTSKLYFNTHESGSGSTGSRHLFCAIKGSAWEHPTLPFSFRCVRACVRAPHTS